MSFRSLALATVFTVSSAVASVAAPLIGTFNVNIYQFSANGNDNAADALLTNPNLTPGNLLAGNVTFTGSLALTSDGTNNTVGGFLGSSGATFSLLPDAASQPISASGYGTTTIFRFDDTLAEGLIGTIIHDDGIGLYQSGVLLTPVGAADPTTPVATAYTISPGTFTLVYSAANGVPEVLNFNVAQTVPVPEPASLALFGAGMLGLGMVSRKRKKTVSATA
jgi:hypothetical protein